VNLERDHARGHEQIVRDYFAEQPVYPESTFRRRYRVSSAVFNKVMHSVVALDSYFVQKPDATGKVGLSALQKNHCPRSFNVSEDNIRSGSEMIDNLRIVVVPEPRQIYPLCRGNGIFLPFLVYSDNGWENILPR
jgi:hypothetical protein